MFNKVIQIVRLTRYPEARNTENAFFIRIYDTML